MTIQTPCSDPANDPNDWFIERNGRQYPDEPVLTEGELRAVAKAIEEDSEDPEAVLFLAVERATEEKVKQALIRRRQAREACFTCPIRLACLDQRLTSEGAVEHGTWGGYFAEDLRTLDVELARRRGQNTYAAEVRRGRSSGV